ASKINAQDLEISSLKARIKLLEDKDRGSVEPTRDDAPIKGKSIEIGEEVGVEKSTKRGSNDTEEMVNVLTSMDAANILTSRLQVVSVPPVAGISTVGVSIVSGLVPTVSAIFTTASVVTPYSRRPIEISTKDKEELKMMIDGLDRNNEVIARHLQEYEESEAKLSIGEKIDLINELAKYQDHHAKILKYQAQQKFLPMASKEEGERVKRKGLKLKQGSAKNMKTSEEVSKEDLKEMMQLVPVEEVYVEALQVKHPIIDWEIHSDGKKDYWKIIRLGGHTVVYQFFMDMLKQLDREDLNQLWALVKETLSIRQASSDKEKELWFELKRMFKPDFEDQLWTHIQALMHDPLEWRLYDTCGVYHERIVGNKMLKAFPLPVMSSYCQKKFPLLVRKFPLLERRDATTEKIALLMKTGKYEHNIDFHQIVDFVEAFHLRIETTDKGTKILATVDGKPRTISESSIKRNLKLRDEAGISSLPDAELFKNLTLMGYNILPN
nr:hypothetical protein [Tanacetum cinerariifolium]